MALSTPFHGSGEFVPDRVWSCPIHDRPEDHYCDCEFCTWEEPECCANADWVDKLDAGGNVIMRELSTMEVLFRNTLRGRGYAEDYRGD